MRGPSHVKSMRRFLDHASSAQSHRDDQRGREEEKRAHTDGGGQEPARYGADHVAEEQAAAGDPHDSAASLFRSVQGG